MSIQLNKCVVFLASFFYNSVTIKHIIFETFTIDEKLYF